MRILIITHDLSETALFDLVIRQSATGVLDLRTQGASVPSLLRALYHRPTRVTQARTLQRLLRGEVPGNSVLVILADNERAEELRTTILRLWPAAQIELPEAVRIP
ncbi:hypothetical protein ANRL2_00604 [Anaerolineae bacterium]|nr:hypothetical protein ANRL2_00604 [Anaerolineae bacterium]